MQHIKKLAALVLIPLLVACSGARDIKLSEITKPENAQKLKETLTAEENRLLNVYVYVHLMNANLDENMTVKEAIEAQRAATEAAKAVKNQIR